MGCTPMSARAHTLFARWCRCANAFAPTAAPAVSVVQARVTSEPIVMMAAKKGGGVTQKSSKFGGGGDPHPHPNPDPNPDPSPNPNPDQARAASV